MHLGAAPVKLYRKVCHATHLLMPAVCACTRWRIASAMTTLALCWVCSQVMASAAAGMESPMPICAGNRGRKAALAVWVAEERSLESGENTDAPLTSPENRCIMDLN